MRKICLAIILMVPTLAWAQRTAEEWYKEGESQYTLQNYEKAVEAFKAGFLAEPDQSKKAAYLYNLGQTYRQAGDCKNALFYYKRFLATRDQVGKPVTGKLRRQVDERLTELETCVALAKKPPTANLAPGGDTDDKSANEPERPTGKRTASDGPPGSVASNDQPEDHGEAEEETEYHPYGRLPRTISARAILGGSKVYAGKIKVPVRFTVAALIGYPIPVNDRVVVEVGGAFTFTPVPYDTQAAPNMPSRSETAFMSSAMANVGLTYNAIPDLGLRVDLGLGGLFFSKVSKSAFTDYAVATGTLTMFHVRAGVSADYAFTPNVVGTLAPFAFTYSPAKSGLAESIKNIRSFDFMVGIGYRM